MVFYFDLQNDMFIIKNKKLKNVFEGRKGITWILSGFNVVQRIMKCRDGV